MLVISPVLEVKELLAVAAAATAGKEAAAAAASGRTTLPPDLNPMPRLLALTLCF